MNSYVGFHVSSSLVVVIYISPCVVMFMSLVFFCYLIQPLSDSDVVFITFI